MELPPAVKIEDVEGGKQVVIVCPEDTPLFKKGAEIFRYETVYTSMDGVNYPSLDAFIQNGILNGFDMHEIPQRKAIEIREVPAVQKVE